MTLTRKVTWDAPVPKRTRNSYEITKIKRTLNERKPEMKSSAYGAAATHLNGTAMVYEVTNLSQGNEGFGRDGLQVKFHRIFYSVVAYATGTQQPVAGVDVYLVTGKNDTAPAYGDFIAYPGGTVNKAEYSTWKQHIIGGENNGCVQAAHHFQYPMKIHYIGSASTSCIRNRTYIVVKNNTGVSVDIKVSSRVWFTDL